MYSFFFCYHLSRTTLPSLNPPERDSPTSVPVVPSCSFIGAPYPYPLLSTSLSRRVELLSFSSHHFFCFSLGEDRENLLPRINKTLRFLYNCVFFPPRPVHSDTQTTQLLCSLFNNSSSRVGFFPPPRSSAGFCIQGSVLPIAPPLIPLQV